MATVVPRPTPSLWAAIVAAVLLDQVAGDGQAKAEAAVIPGRAAVGLPEAIEDVGQEVGRDADAGIANLDLERAATDVAVDARSPRLRG